MKKNLTNIAASKRAKLENIARSQGRSLELLLLLYMEERLLYRISQSPLSDRFILKGGLLLYSLFGHTARPTRDIDALARELPTEPQELAELFKPVCRLDYPDGVLFDADSIQAEIIREGAHYQGARLFVNASLGNARNRLQLDIGFFDVVTPQPRRMEYPVLLDDPPPLISVYSLESVIAEKFEAMLSLGIANSRMKDFYDVEQLARTQGFDGAILSEAVTQTLKRRRTTRPEQPLLFSAEFATDSVRITRWKAFLRSVTADPVEFTATMKLLQDFLAPVYRAHLTHSSINGQWDPHSCSWR